MEVWICGGGGGILGPSDLDLGKKIASLDFGGGDILGHSDLDSDNFHLGGGYSGTLEFGLSDNFHLGGGILGHSDLDSLTIFIGGGYSGTL